MTAGAEPTPSFEAFFEHGDDPCCVVRMERAAGDATVRLLHANAAFRREAGPGDAWPRRLGQTPWRELIDEVQRGGGERRACLRVQASSWVEVHAFSMGGPSSPVGVRLHDITERRLRVERLIGLRRISTVGVLFWGPGFELVDANEGFMRMSGFSRAEAMGKTWQELTPPEHHATSWDAVRQVSLLGEAVPYEKEYFRKDGTRWWGLFAPRKIGDVVIEFVLDVTQQRLAQAALRASDRRKDEFLATLAHELRNPLAPIKNGLQILRLSTAAESRSSRTLDMVDRQLDHLVRLVDDLMDVARISSGKIRVVPEVVAVREVLARSLESVHTALEAKGHRLSVELRAEDALVSADPDRLAQVFSNLLLNAVKYTPSGGTITLRLDDDGPGDAVTVSVIDTGVGIPADQQSAVFDLFSQVRDHQPHSEGGLGIGLALVASLVRLHGGSVDVHSEGAGRGSTFRVRLPRVRGNRIRHQDSRIAMPAPQAPRRILVADDNADAADSLAWLLRAAGHEVVTACDGREAVEVARAARPHVAFLDLGMPGMDGLSAASQMRADPALAGTRLIALTGWGQPSDRERTAAAGFHLHLVKPLTATGLQAALDISGAAAQAEPGVGHGRAE